MQYTPHQPDQDPEPTPPAPRRDVTPVAFLLGGIGLVSAIIFSVVLMTWTPTEAPTAPPVAPEDPTQQPVTALAPEEAPAEEIEAPRSPADQLRDAQAQVESLQTELDARDAELATLQQQVAARDAKDEAARERSRLRQAAVAREIAGLRDALKVAQDERDGLRSELKDALAEIDRQVAQNTKLRHTAVAYKEANTENLWSAFTNNAKVRICDRGTYHRRADCEADLDTWFDEQQHAAFTSCVNTAQAIPLLWQADGQEVPAQAKQIAARDRERKDEWYVVYCDPTLPEGALARDITEEAPQVFASASR